jgi:pimeloyl-ACP methyl ester carboxylesterase
MAETLDPGGVPVATDGVVLTTPGLAGTAQVHYPGGRGMRAADQATAAFLDALDQAGVEEQLTVEITGTAEVDGVEGSRAAGGDTDILAEVPGPGTGLGQFLLYLAEDGTASWHLPVDVEAEERAVATRGGDRRTYRVPRAVLPPAPTGHRGLAGAVASKLLKVLVFPLIDPVLGKVGDFFAARWERQHRRNLLRSFDTTAYRLADAGPAPDWAALSAGPALLFLHGTGSRSHTGFGRVPEALLAELHRRYGGRVLAMDHFTVSVDPTENARWLATTLPDRAGLTVDVIAHSRGGLVGRVLAEHAEELGLGGKLTVRTLVMVGTPNAGTVLADREHLGRLLDRLTNLAQLVPDNPVTDTIDVVLTLLKQLAVGAFGGLSGIMAMDPRGRYLLDYLNRPATTAAAYRAVASNFEPAQGSSLLRTARDGLTDVIFGTAHNDLVVPTDGVFEIGGLAGFAPVDPLVFTAEAGVDHSSYWTQPAFERKILEWLPG